MRLLGLPRYARWSLGVGIALLFLALAGTNGRLVVLGLAALTPLGWFLYARSRKSVTHEAYPWPSDLRAAAEGMARPIDPKPHRILPEDPNAPVIAEVATTQDGLDRMLADKPPLWRWAAFTSVLVQRRNTLLPRLRNCALGYQPNVGPPISGQAYAALAGRALQNIADLVTQLEQFMLSPGFTGLLKSFSEADGAEPDSVLHLADRLMDYHQSFLTEAERCLQTPVETDVIVFVQDMAAFTMCPLAGYEQFIPALCSRIAEGRELVRYTDGTVLLDDVNLAIALPDGLMERITAHIRRFSP